MPRDLHWCEEVALKLPKEKKKFPKQKQKMFLISSWTYKMQIKELCFIFG
jgi:hypothetical protein